MEILHRNISCLHYTCIIVYEYTEFADGAVLLKRQTTLSRFLSVPDLRMNKSYQPKSSARVLTSVENLQRIEEKESTEGKGSIKERATKKKGGEATAEKSRFFILHIMHVYVKKVIHACTYGIRGYHIE